MITRRAFLAALAALPVVGRLVPEPWYIETTIGTSGTSAKAMLADMDAYYQTPEMQAAIRAQVQAMSSEWDQQALRHVYDKIAAQPPTSANSKG